MEKKLNKKVSIYLLIILIIEVLYFFLCLLTRGHVFSSVFFGDVNDTFSDFFKPLYNWHGNPWRDTDNGNYPALAMLFYKLCFHFIPLDVSVGNGLEYRCISQAWLIFILASIFVLIIVNYCMRTLLRIDEKNKEFCFVTLLFSAPVLFAIERGNMIVNLSFALILFFVVFYDNDNAVLRELSIIALAIAAGIRIYPAIFGILLLNRKYYKSAIRATIYGAFAFFAPFLYYGPGSLMRWIRTITRMKGELLTFYGYNYSLENMYNLTCTFFSVSIPRWVYYAFLAITFIVLTIIGIKTKEKAIKVMSCVLLGIIIPAQSFEYGLLFLLIPFLYYMNELYDDIGNWDWIKSIIFVLLLSPLPFPVIWSYTIAGYYLTWSYVVYFIALYAGTIWFVIKNRSLLKLCVKKRVNE